MKPPENNLADSKAHAMPYETAMRYLFSTMHTEPLTDPIKAEMKAVISHWLHTPKAAPLIIQKHYGDRWRRQLHEFFNSNLETLSKKPFSALKYRGAPGINFNNVPFPPPHKHHFTFIDLFAGIGGFRIALQKLGGKCVFSSEWDPHAKETYFNNFGEYPFGDITQFTNRKPGRDALFPKSVPKHNILTAGFPCQAFSNAGKKLGFEDARGTLFFEVLKLTKNLTPDALILENVKGLRGHDKGRTFQVIKRSLEQIGYTVYDAVLHAYEFGLAQKRDRIFIVAFRKKVAFNFPEPPTKRLYNCVGDVLESNVDASFTISSRIHESHLRRQKAHRARGNGFGFSLFDGTSPHTNTISARYWKDGSEALIRQDQANPRMLTPRECARLQGFPDAFLCHKSNRFSYNQFGNAVPVPVVKAIATQVLKALGSRNTT